MNNFGWFIVVIIIIWLMTLLGCYLWNWLAVMIFGLPVLTMWEFFWLLVLSRMLFAGTGK